jgi:hypothetical protein
MAHHCGGGAAREGEGEGESGGIGPFPQRDGGGAWTVSVAVGHTPRPMRRGYE